MTSRAPLVFLNREADGGDEPTEADRAWWREASKPDWRRHLALWVPWMTGIFIIPTAIRNPHAFFGGRWLFELPLGISVGFLGALFMWRLMSPELLKARLAGKRIRDALLEGAAVRVGTGERE